MAWCCVRPLILVLASREATPKNPFYFEVHRDVERCSSPPRRRTNPDASGNRG